MPILEKSDVMKNVLTTMISISGRKTSQGDAISTMDSVITRLEDRYDFLKNIEIHDIRFSEERDAVKVLPDINNIGSDDFRNAIQEIVTAMTTSLGRNAGHFFIKELQKRLGDEYTSFLSDMGIDLSLLQLESEVVKF